MNFGSEYEEAPDEVLELANSVIAKHHEHLMDARIGFIMRARAPRRGSMVTWGYARGVSKENQVFVPFDFIITLSEDVWDALTELQRTALIDHELCHCIGYPDHWTTKGHDFEEFFCIIDRYGFWRDEGKQATFIQESLIKHPPQGHVGKVNPKAFTSALLKESVSVTFGKEHADVLRGAAKALRGQRWQVIDGEEEDEE